MRLLYSLFFLSGAAGLVYQVVWSRLLQDVFGVTVYAVTAVVAAFLAGLALGGVVIGKISDRGGNMLRLYGLLECGIALSALACTEMIHLLEGVHLTAANALPPGSPTLLLVRALLASVVVLPPTFLMGGTLPVVTKALVPKIEGLGKKLSLLYALNTFGAVCGSLGAGFMLIRLIGLQGTLWVAAAVNAAVGIASLALAAKGKPASPSLDNALASESPSGASRIIPHVGLLVVLFVSGFASLGSEILWTRALIVILGTSTYAFVTVLSSFLLGIALGSIAARWVIARQPEIFGTLGWVQMLIAGSTVTSLVFLSYAGAAGADGWLLALESNWLAATAAKFGLSFLVVLIPAVFIGMVFPLGASIWARELRSLGGRVGQAYGSNTAGNIVGSVCTGFLLLPIMGIQKTAALLAALNVASAAWCLLFVERQNYPQRPLLDRVPLGAGLGLFATALVFWKPVFSVHEADTVLYYREGIAATVKVTQRVDDPTQRWMLVDGVSIGQSFGGADEKQQALAHFPFLLMGQHPRRVLSIGLGTGILMGEVVRHSSVQSAVCAEISPSVIEASREFADLNGIIMTDPRVTIVCDDGVNYLRRRKERYDLIISDAKSRTGHAGNALFFSADYYRLCRSRLNKEGMMIQWVPLDESPRDLRIIMRTFVRQFPRCYLWLSPPGQCFLIGMNSRLTLDIPSISKGMRDSAVSNLSRYGWTDPYGLVAFLCADRDALMDWLDDDGQINTLEHPILEFYSPRDYSVPEHARIAANLTALARLRRHPVDDVDVLCADPQRLSEVFGAASMLARGLALVEGVEGEPQTAALELVARALKESKGSAPVEYSAARFYLNHANKLAADGEADQAISYYRLALQEKDKGPWALAAEAHLNLGIILAAEGEPEEAVVHFRKALKANPNLAAAQNEMGLVLATRGELDKAISCFEAALTISPSFESARANLHHAKGSVPESGW